MRALLSTPTSTGASKTATTGYTLAMDPQSLAALAIVLSAAGWLIWRRLPGRKSKPKHREPTGPPPGSWEV